jgi:hypothetical protein
LAAQSQQGRAVLSDDAVMTTAVWASRASPRDVLSPGTILLAVGLCGIFAGRTVLTPALEPTSHMTSDVPVLMSSGRPRLPEPHRAMPVNASP